MATIIRMDSRSRDALVEEIGRKSGTYQWDVFCGNQRWSGSDLQGKARTWGAKYAQSRASLCDKIKIGKF